MKEFNRSTRIRIYGLGFVLMILASTPLLAQRYDVIEDFESGSVNLTSWQNEDVSPGSWQLTNTVTHNGSAWALALTGNTWKAQTINPVVVDSGTVFQMAAMTSNGAKYQGIGFYDGTNALFYSISGTTTLDIEQWIPVYQGAFSNGTWNLYQFPIADDWYSFFDYLPTITTLVYVNDLDGVSARSVWFDSIYNITDDLNVAPLVSVSSQITFDSRDGLTRDVGVQFLSTVVDPDSDSFTYRWDFGDGQSSTNPNPYHVFTVTDDHPYRVTLKVTDTGGRWGLASCIVNVDQGEGNLPLRMNFVGDIMLARRYEQAGGIIPTQGVNAIFTPTLSMLGEAADITVANLEVVLTNVGTPHPTKSVVYRGNPANISGLVYAGIDKVSLANNHTLDYGAEGMNQMIGLLDQNNIIHSGSGVDSYAAYTPAFVNQAGLNIAFLASCDRTGQYNNAQPFLQAGYNKPGFAYMTPYYMMQQLAAVDGVADLKIMELHGGSEYSLTPGSDYDKNMAFVEDTEDEDYDYRTDVPHMWDIAIRHFAIDSGADLVIVHHPHIVQALELYQGKLIAHSLGNYIFDLNYPETMPSMILYADADHSGFSNYHIRPVYINAYIPKPATGQLGTYILEYIAHRSTELNTKLIVDTDDMSASVLTPGIPVSVTSSQYTFNQTVSPIGTQGNYTAPFKLTRYGSISSLQGVSPVSDAQARLATEMIWYGNFEDEGSTLWDVGSFSTTEKVDGLRSATIAPSSGQTSTATIKERCKWYDNTKKYTLHGWIKTENAVNANIIIRYFNTRTSYLLGTETVTLDITGTSDWTWYYKELNIPSNAWYYDIRLTCTNSVGGSAQAWFDNVGLMEWTPWAELSSYQLIPYPNYYYWMQIKTQENAKSVNVTFSEQRISKASPGRKETVPPVSNLKAYPNPFRDIANIEFENEGKGKTSLVIYNLRGQKVRTLTNETLPKGKHRFFWDGSDDKGRPAACGVYFIRLSQGNRVNTTKVVLIK